MVSLLDCKIAELVRLGRTAKEIAAILGRNQAVVSRDCQRLGITPVRIPTGELYGLTDKSLPLRMDLAGCLVDIQQAGATPTEISEITGLTRRQIPAATSRPFNHDWTLTQIERTLTYFGKTLKDYI